MRTFQQDMLEPEDLDGRLKHVISDIGYKFAETEKYRVVDGFKTSEFVYRIKQTFIDAGWQPPKRSLGDPCGRKYTTESEPRKPGDDNGKM